MTTAIAQKTPVEKKWSAEKVREEATRIIATQYMVAQKVLAKYGQPAIEEFENQMRAHKVEHYRKLGVKTPIDLVKAMAEFESNVFGSDIVIVGDDSKATLTYNACGMWNAMQKAEKLTPEMEEKMGEGFQRCVSNLTKEFGFKSEVKFEEPCATITITK